MVTWTPAVRWGEQTLDWWGWSVRGADRLCIGHNQDIETDPRAAAFAIRITAERGQLLDERTVRAREPLDLVLDGRPATQGFWYERWDFGWPMRSWAVFEAPRCNREFEQSVLLRRFMVGVLDTRVGFKQPDSGSQNIVPVTYGHFVRLPSLLVN